jgi:hypothetical protein
MGRIKGVKKGKVKCGKIRVREKGGWERGNGLRVREGLKMGKGLRKGWEIIKEVNGGEMVKGRK